MWSAALPRPAHRGICVVATAGLLSACAPGAFTTQSQRIGSDDGTDSCRRELVALDSTGNFFAEDIVKGAAIGALAGALLGGLSGGSRGALIGAATGGVAGAAGGYFAALQSREQNQAQLVGRMQSDLQAEGVQLDRTQIAFSQLADCRFYEAEAIRNAYAAGQIPRAVAVQQMAVVRQRAQKDLALARLINDKIMARGQQFDLAADQVSPGYRSYVEATKPQPRPVVTRAAVPIKLQPTDQSPAIAQAQARERLTVRATRGDYALVETPTGTRGYAPVSSLDLPPSPTVQPGDEVRSLAGSNANRRDSFAQSVAVVESAQAGAFEIAG
jgi:YMGG-like Gly-zipper